MSDFIDDDFLLDSEDEVSEEIQETQVTFKESQQTAVMRFCDNLNPRNFKDKPLVALCQEYKKYSIDASNIAQDLQDNELLPFLNIRYVVMAKMYEDSNEDVKQFAKRNNLDTADLIRYIEINNKYL